MRIPGWPALNPAQLRHQIHVQSQTTAPGAIGQVQQTWTTVLTVNGGINMLLMREVFGAEQLTSQVSDLWTIRYAAGIAPGMRIVFGTRIFRIQAVHDEQKRGVLLHLLCLELNNPS